MHIDTHNVCSLKSCPFISYIKSCGDWKERGVGVRGEEEDDGCGEGTVIERASTIRQDVMVCADDDCQYLWTRPNSRERKQRVRNTMFSIQLSQGPPVLPDWKLFRSWATVTSNTGLTVTKPLGHDSGDRLNYALTTRIIILIDHWLFILVEIPVIKPSCSSG